MIPTDRFIYADSSPSLFRLMKLISKAKCIPLRLVNSGTEYLLIRHGYTSLQVERVEILDTNYRLLGGSSTYTTYRKDGYTRDFSNAKYGRDCVLIEC